MPYNGNPGGKPSYKPDPMLTKGFAELLEYGTVDGQPVLKNGARGKEKALKGWLRGCQKGNPGCLKLAVERIDGPQDVNVNFTFDDGPLTEEEQKEIEAENQEWTINQLQPLNSTDGSIPPIQNGQNGSTTSAKETPPDSSTPT